MIQFDRHNVVVIGVLTLLILLTLWMQFILFERISEDEKELASNDPDYYIEYFSSFGVDADGKQYELEADRMVHYPLDNKALLDRPHITQYDENSNPFHIYADSGWLFSDGTEILLTDNVKLIQSQGTGLGGASTAKRMRIKLKPKDDN
jgi:LPS export ABC transporter protein LptC